MSEKSATNFVGRLRWWGEKIRGRSLWTYNNKITQRNTRRRNLYSSTDAVLTVETPHRTVIFHQKYDVYLFYKI